MQEIIETLRMILHTIGEVSEILLNALSLVCILTGVFFSFKQIDRKRLNSGSAHPLHSIFRMAFGGWLVLALEFQLAADIVSTILLPSTGHLIELGAVAAIRTLLSYFLNKELMEEHKHFSSASGQTNATVA